MSDPYNTASMRMSDPYNTPSNGNQSALVSDLVAPLADGKGWIKFLAIVQIVFSALYVLISFGIGIIVMWLPIWLGVLLLQSANALEQAQARGDAEAMKLAMGKLKLYFLIQAIAMIVGFGLAILGIIAAITLGVSMRQFMHH